MVPAGTMTLVVTENLAPSTHLLVSLEPLVNSKREYTIHILTIANAKNMTILVENDESRLLPPSPFPSFQNTTSKRGILSMITWNLNKMYGIPFRYCAIPPYPLHPNPPISPSEDWKSMNPMKDMPERKDTNNCIFKPCYENKNDKQHGCKKKRTTIQGHFVTCVDHIPNLPCKWHSNKANEMPNKYMIWRTCIQKSNYVCILRDCMGMTTL